MVAMVTQQQVKLGQIPCSGVRQSKAFNYIHRADLQAESETAVSEFRLNNATQRLMALERDIGLLKQKAENSSVIAEAAEKVTQNISQVTEAVQKVCVNDMALGRIQTFSECLGAVSS